MNSMRSFWGAIIFMLAAIGTARAQNLYRGIYVDHFDKLLQDTADSQAFLGWAQKNGIQYLSCYDLYTVLSKKELTEKLVVFMKMGQQQYGIRSFDAVASSAEFLIEKVYPFNLKYGGEGVAFNGFNLEREWWTEEVTFQSHKENMNRLKGFIRDSSVMNNLSLETYIGWFGLVQTSKEAEAMALIQYSDLISVSAYQKHLRFSYLKSRLEELAKAAEQTHKKQNVVIIFSMERKFSGKHSRKHSYEDMYDELMKEYAQAKKSGSIDPRVEKYLNIKGWKVFAQSYARNFRP
jgi:hypothetical protein